MAKKEIEHSSNLHKMKPLRAASLRGFFSFYVVEHLQVVTDPVYCLTIYDVVTYHTSHDSNYKRKNIIQIYTSFLSPDWSG